MKASVNLTREMVSIFIEKCFESNIEKSREYRYNAYMSSINDAITRDLNRYEAHLKDVDIPAWGCGDILKAWSEVGLDSISDSDKQEYAVMCVKRNYDNYVMGLPFPFSSTFGESFDEQCLPWFIELKDFMLSYPDSIIFSSTDYKMYRNECLGVLDCLYEIRKSIK